jgi:hypothetical protein
MSYFKRVKLDNIPFAEILTHITIPNGGGQVVPLSHEVKFKLAELLKIDLDQCVQSRIMLVYFPPFGFVNIHSDKPVEDLPEGKLDQCVIVPIDNFQDVEWTWYEILDHSKIYHYGQKENWKTVPMIPPTATNAVEKIKCNSAFIADIGTWHSLKNFSTKPAIALSIRLMPWSYQDFKTCQTLPPVSNLTILNEQDL